MITQCNTCGIEIPKHLLQIHNQEDHQINLKTKRKCKPFVHGKNFYCWPHGGIWPCRAT